MKKPLRPKAKLRLLKMASAIVVTAPLATIVAINWDQYAPREVEGSSVQLSFGLIAAVLLIFLIQFKKIQVKSAFFGLAVIFGLSIILQPIIRDLQLLSGVALAGAFIDLLFFHHAISEMEETVKMTKSAEIQATAMVVAQDMIEQKRKSAGRA